MPELRRCAIGFNHKLVSNEASACFLESPKDAIVKARFEIKDYIITEVGSLLSDATKLY